MIDDETTVGPESIAVPARDGVRIRERCAQDLDACVAALALVHQEQGYPSLWPTDPARWLSPADALRVFVAVDADDRVLGQVLLRQSPDQERATLAEVARLFVVPGEQGTGLGRALLEHVCRRAADQGLGLVLEVVEDGRSGAIRLYERAGWRHTETVVATWTGPDGAPVTLRRYALARA